MKLLSLLFTISTIIGQQNLPETALNYPGNAGGRPGCNHWVHPVHGPYYAPPMWVDGSFNLQGRFTINTIVTDFPVPTLYILMMTGWVPGTQPRLMDPTWTGTNTCQLYVGIQSPIITFIIGPPSGTLQQVHSATVNVPNVSAIVDSYFLFQWVRYFDDAGTNRILTSPGVALKVEQ